MKILFSPSEAKFSGGQKIKINKNSFVFPELFEKRMEAVIYYQEYIDNASHNELSVLLGLKKEDALAYYKGDLLNKEIMKAVERYNGVAYDYLKYQSLDNNSKQYIDKNVIIFSNLFGPILAGDYGLPDYKLKQGEKVGKLALENFYYEHFSEAINRFINNEEIIDLRAGFYEKFYKLNKPYTVMKFIKDGKVVSHWAKAYRGIVLKEIAKNNIQSIDEFMKIQIENLIIKEIKTQKLKTEITYDILF